MNRNTYWTEVGLNILGCRLTLNEKNRLGSC